MSRTVVIPLASSKGRKNSRLPVGSPAPVRCRCMSARPGIKNFPVASSTLAARGVLTDDDGPRSEMRPSEMSTVDSGNDCPALLTSMTVTWVMASTPGRDEEQEMLTNAMASRKRTPNSKVPDRAGVVLAVNDKCWLNPDSGKSTL